MNLHNLKQDYPKMPVEIKNMISSEVEHHVTQKKENKFRKYKSIAAAAAIVLFAGTTVYAADKLIELHAKKTGNYSYETEIINSQDSMTTEFILNEGEYLTVDFNYFPEPLAISGEEKLTLIDPANPNPYYSNIIFYELPESGEANYTEHTNIISKEELTIGNMPAILYEENYIPRRSFIYEVICKDYNILIQMSFDDRLSEVEAAKIIENMSFSKTTNPKANNIIDIFKLDSESSEPETYICVDNPELPTYATKNELNSFHSIGETFTITGIANMQETNIDVCVRNVQIYDNINQIPSDFTNILTWYNGENPDFVDEEGNVLPNTLYFMKWGDGVNSINEVLETKTTNTKLVYIEVDYTNPSDANPIIDFLFHCELYPLNDMGDYYEISKYTLKKEIEGCDGVTADICNPTVSTIFYSNGTNAENKNHISYIAPGETHTVYHLFLVQEDELDNMYIDLQESLGAGEFMNRDNFNISFVDISQ